MKSITPRPCFTPTCFTLFCFCYKAKCVTCGCPHILVAACILLANLLFVMAIQGVYKISAYFAKLDDKGILCNKTVHTTFRLTSQEDHYVQIAVGTRIEPQQIPGHTNYARSVRPPTLVYAFPARWQ
jgi:hypothetical protein